MLIIITHSQWFEKYYIAYTYAIQGHLFLRWNGTMGKYHCNCARTTPYVS